MLTKGMKIKSFVVTQLPPRFGFYTVTVVGLAVLAFTAMVYINADADANRVVAGVRNAHIAGHAPL